MEDDGEGQVTRTVQVQPSQFTRLDTRAKEYLKQVQDLVNSPNTQLVLRNSILTLLEVEDRDFTLDSVLRLLTDDNYRGDIVRRLKKKTPEYWSEKWNSSWNKDLPPIMSRVQEQISKRNSLIAFWTDEYETLALDMKAVAVQVFKSWRDKEK